MAVALVQVAASILIMTLIWILVLSRRKSPKAYPPGPMSLPLIGNLHQLGNRPFIKCIGLQKQYGDTFTIDFGGYRGIVLNSYKAIREGLNMPEFSGRPKLLPFVEKAEGNPSGIVVNEGQSWIEHRRFTVRNLRDFGFGKKSMELLTRDEVQELLEALSNLNGKPTEIQRTFHLAVVNGLWLITVGERFEHSDPKLAHLVDLFTDGLSNSPAAGLFFFFPWLAKIAPNLTGYNSFMDFQRASTSLVRDKVIQEKATFKTGQHRHFLDVYIEAVSKERNPTSYFYGDEGERNMVGAVTDLFLGGIETTATVLSWTVMLLTVHPIVQEKLFEEIESVVGTSRLPSFDDERSLPYAKAVMHEALRISSILPLGIFHSSQTDVEFRGYTIPKDTLIVPNLYAANRDPEIWSEPDKFMPERFIGPNGSLKKNTNLVLTFSTGKRVCPGETLARNELFLFITSLFQKFKVEPNPEKPSPVIDYTPTFIMHPASYEYCFIPRNCNIL